MERDRLIHILKDYYLAKEEVSFGFLFGSYAAGQPKKTSDIDIGVYLGDDGICSSGYKLDETVQLEDLLKKPVDLIIFNEAPPLLTHEIFKHGIPFIDRDHALLVKFRVANFYKYLDQRYIINHYFAAAKARIEGRNDDGQ